MTKKFICYFFLKETLPYYQTISILYSSAAETLCKNLDFFSKKKKKKKKLLGIQNFLSEPRYNFLIASVVQLGFSFCVHFTLSVSVKTKKHSVDVGIISSLPHIESQNHQGWKRPTGSSSPTIPPSSMVLIKPCPSQHPNVP